jgi:peptidoglycan/xylan/chitin deacetylase (PgdA/CDA1 family)
MSGLVRARRAARELAKSALAGTFAYGGVGWALRRARRAIGGPRIHLLAYHRVVDRPPPGVNPALCIGVDAFARQMRQARARFEVLSLPEALAAVRGERALARDACAITFDDGYRDVLTRAAPILEALGLPATVFVPTDYAGAPRPLLHDRLYAALIRRASPPARQPPPPLDAALARAYSLAAAEGAGPALDALLRELDPDALAIVERHLEEGAPPALDEDAAVLAPDELRRLADRGWEIGAHTASHAVLVGLPAPRVRAELDGPRRLLADWTGRPCRFFAYCNGLHDPRLRAAVRAAGYQAAVTTHARTNRVGDDPLRLGRQVLSDAHARGAFGRFSASRSSSHLHGLFTLVARGDAAPDPGAVDVAPSPARPFPQPGEQP